VGSPVNHATIVVRHLVAIVALVGLLSYVVVHVVPWVDAPIHSDGYSYYVYLPSWFLNHDPTLQTVADDCCGGTFPAFTSIVRWPATGRWVNPHPIGVALQMLPLFAVAHLLTRWSNLPPDGFSLYYQHAAGLAGLAAFVAGLAVLRRLLARYFSVGVVAATLATITFGTNLFHYATFDSTFSHAFSFFLIAALLDLTDRWLTDPGWRTSLTLAVVAALIVLTRHPNIVFLLIVPLSDRRLVRTRWRLVLAMAAMTVFCVTPQLLVYKQATGHWFVSVYGEIGRFNFSSPRVVDVLVGVQKGLFFWSPVLLLAVAGFFGDNELARRLRVAAALTFAIDVYVIASWSDWQFGASFGHRGFTDGLAVAAVYVAACFEWAARRSRRRIPVAIVTCVLVLLSSAQMAQYWMGILPIANTTWDQYRDVFLRFR
jgi:hypothetical protein